MAAATSSGVASSDYNNRVLVSDSECDFILSGCRVNCRLDGRKRLDFRQYQIIVSDDELLPLSHGSARLIGSVGHSSTEQQHLICSVKAELVHPSPQAPYDGVVELHLNSGSISNNNNRQVTRRDLEQSQETLSQLLSGRLVDTRALCINPGEYVWRLAVDVLLLEASGGSFLDCAARVIAAGLASTRLPQVTTSTGSDDSTGDAAAALTVDGDYAKSHSIPLPTIAMPDQTTRMLSVCIITVAVMQDFDLATKRPLYSLIVDATLAEESCALALVHVCVQLEQTADHDKETTTAPTNARIVGLQKTQQGALPLTLLPDITNTALEAAASADAAFVKVQEPRSETKKNKNKSTLLQEKFQWVMVGDGNR